MEVTGEIAFGVLSLGYFGWLVGSSMYSENREGFGVMPNLLGGAFGSLIVGVLALVLEVAGQPVIWIFRMHDDSVFGQCI
ncbi:MAG: hypothetical protein U5K69_14925 [Balneolaceae bacterium]|nr:hypothetical protein [Balneolaceae bacterium]